MGVCAVAGSEAAVYGAEAAQAECMSPVPYTVPVEGWVTTLSNHVHFLAAPYMPTGR